MRTETKRRVRDLVAAIAVCGASLALLPGVAQAQGLNVGPVTAPVAAQVGDVVGADSQTETVQGVSTNEPSLVTGGVTDTTAVEAPVVPVQSTVTVDDTVAAPGLVEEDVCLNAGVNSAPGSCGGATTPPPAPVDETVVNSQTGIPQTVSPAEDSLVTGGVTDTTGVNAPIVPVEGSVAVDETVSVPGVVEEDVCLNVGVNEAPGSCGDATNPSPGDPGDGIVGAVGDLVNDPSDDVVVDVEADAPVPVETGADAQVDAVVEDVADLGVCADVDVNQETPGCQTDGSDGGVDLPEIPLPESDGPDLDADAGVGEDIGAGVCLDGVLGEDGSCDEASDESGEDQDGIIDACVGVLDSGLCQQGDGDQSDNDGQLVGACVGVLDPGCSEGSGEATIADICIGILASACPRAANDDNGNPGEGNPDNGDDPGDDNGNPGDDNGNPDGDPGDDDGSPGDDGDGNGDDPGGNPDAGDDDGNSGDGNGSGNDDGGDPGDDNGSSPDGSISDSGDTVNGGDIFGVLSDSGAVTTSSGGAMGASGSLSSGEMVFLSGPGVGGATDSGDAGSEGGSDDASTDGSSGMSQLPDTGGVDPFALRALIGTLLLAFGLTGFLMTVRRRSELR